MCVRLWRSLHLQDAPLAQDLATLLGAPCGTSFASNLALLPQPLIPDDDNTPLWSLTSCSEATANREPVLETADAVLYTVMEVPAMCCSSTPDTGFSVSLLADTRAGCNAVGALLTGAMEVRGLPPPHHVICSWPSQSYLRVGITLSSSDEVQALENALVQVCVDGGRGLGSCGEIGRMRQRNVWKCVPCMAIDLPAC